MKYEAIQTNDFKRCAEFFTEVFNSSPWNENWDVVSALRRLTEKVVAPGFVGLKVVSKDRVLGFAMGYAEFFNNGVDFYLEEMCIPPAMQRQGIGTALLDELKTRLSTAGTTKMHLLTSRDGPAARFYEKNGFYSSEKMIVMGYRLKPRE
jgi:ribosomal protein S18 acetylase RimI-like enzyme